LVRNLVRFYFLDRIVVEISFYTKLKKEFISMKVYNLACPLNHQFEGWFSSEEDFSSQKERAVLCCPMCDSIEIARMPSAPYIGGRSHHHEQTADAFEKTAMNLPSTNDAMHLTPEQKVQFQEKMQAMMLQVVREIMEKTDNVGESFAEEARKIHYKEAPERSIRGVTTIEQAAELMDEGIDVYSLPVPPSLKATLQ
jgi:hypothetical protein